MLTLNDVTMAYMCPCVLCLNETEHLVLDQSAKCKVIFFHPSAINCAFDFHNIREFPMDCSITFEQDA